MANREGNGRRYRHNLQGLLRLAMDHSEDPESGTSSVFQEMSEEVSASRLEHEIRTYFINVS